MLDGQYKLQAIFLLPFEHDAKERIFFKQMAQEEKWKN